jgi:hypothetical protein
MRADDFDLHSPAGDFNIIALAVLDDACDNCACLTALRAPRTS